MTQHPDIADAAVVGLPDPVYGEAVAAFIELRRGAELTAEAVGAHCANLLAGYKKPRILHFVEALPRNSRGQSAQARAAQAFCTTLSARRGNL